MNKERIKLKEYNHYLELVLLWASEHAHSTMLPKCSPSRNIVCTNSLSLSRQANDLVFMRSSDFVYGKCNFRINNEKGNCCIFTTCKIRCEFIVGRLPFSLSFVLFALSKRISVKFLDISYAKETTIFYTIV